MSGFRTSTLILTRPSKFSLPIVRKCSNASSPLQGIRILDMTRILAGPYCTMILGDLGAEIIKIEQPGIGDDTRHWGPPFLESMDGTSKESCYFFSVNRNKKSMALNFQSTQGRQILQKLAQNCDVLVENFVPGKLAQYDLDYESLRSIAPQLIYCSITGFGESGPYSNRAGYDVIAASIGGLLHITGPKVWNVTLCLDPKVGPTFGGSDATFQHYFMKFKITLIYLTQKDGDPCKVGVAMTDLATGLYAHGAIMAALLQRLQTGKGQKINCDLLSTQVSTLVNLGSNYLNGGQESGRWGTAHASIVPYQSFRTKDGYFTIGCGNDGQFKDFCQRLDMSDLPQKFVNNETRVKNRHELVALIEAKMQQKTNQEWNQLLTGAKFPYGPVNTLAQVFQDEQVVYNNMVREIKDENFGCIKQVGPAVKFSHAYNEPRGCPPRLGQHTEEILSKILDYSEAEIKTLKNEKVIN